jgi:serine/threonine protein kinase/DNA-directed RNA polymerase specialized sigma24 family protein
MPDVSDLSLSADWRIEAVCSRFEEAWKTGQRLRLEDLLGETPGRERQALLRELVKLELELRVGRGEEPAQEEYLARFPQAAELIASIFAPGARTRVPGYEILEELGRGGMGVVYKARHRGSNRLVALKMLAAQDSLFGDSQDLRNAFARLRFYLESRTGSRIHHRNIVPVYDVGEYQGQPYFTMELVTGGSLTTVMAALREDHPRTARLLGQIAGAVHYAHENGVLHRDLKPSNILLDAEGQPHVADFGVLKLIRPAHLTRSSTRVGTAAYMAPEQAEGKGVGRPADVWALGAILYECLTGQPPFKSGTVRETISQVIRNNPVPPVLRQPKTPPALADICLHCLHKDPGQRYGSAKDLADDLGRFERGESIKGPQPVASEPREASAAGPTSPGSPVKGLWSRDERGCSVPETIWPVLWHALDGADGDATAAQQVILEKYRPAMHRYLIAYLSDADAADELCQEFSLRFVRGDFRKANPEKGRFRDLLKSSLYHLIVDHHKRRKRAIPQLSPDAPEPAASPESMLESDRQFLDAWRADLLAKAWAALAAEEHRTGRPLHTVLHFRSVHPELRSAQMAVELSQRLGKEFTADWVRKWLHAAREKFADLLLIEVSSSLREATPEAVEQELIDLDLFRYCKEAMARRR